jgi:hypothetical protein
MTKATLSPAEKSDRNQNLAIALMIGLALPPAVGFGTGLWVTKDDAARKLDTAVVAARTTICVAQFTRSPDSKARLVAYKDMEYGARSTFFEKGGWDKMPGEEKAQDSVTRACGEQLDTLSRS